MKAKSSNAYNNATYILLFLKHFYCYVLYNTRDWDLDPTTQPMLQYYGVHVQWKRDFILSLCG